MVELELHAVCIIEGEVVRQYRLHRDLDRELQWMGPLEELPPKLG